MPRIRMSASILFCASATVMLAGQQLPLNPLSPGGLATGGPTGGQDTGGHVLISPLTQPTLTPGVLQLMELESRFSADVARGGGKAFAAWFTDDAVVLNNGKPPVLGRSAIAQQAQWDPATYQLTWTPQGAQMGPSNDMGYTWGRYEGHARDNNGQPIVLTGRYMTVWKKMPGGAWKVSLEASANEAPNAGDCCALPKP